MSAGHTERFGGVRRLMGTGALEGLKAAHVCVVGVGGVGSWTVEGLARSGVGALTLIDLDDVCVTNVNRQLPALDGQIGRPKVVVLADRVKLINPECRVTAITDFNHLVKNHLNQVGANAVIDDGLGNTITIINTLVANLNNADFTF